MPPQMTRSTTRMANRYPNVFEVRNGSDPNGQSSIPASTYVVNGAGGGAYTTVGAALSAANVANGAYQIIAIAPGVYTGTASLSGVTVTSSKPKLVVDVSEREDSTASANQAVHTLEGVGMSVAEFKQEIHSSFIRSMTLAALPHAAPERLLTRRSRIVRMLVLVASATICACRPVAQQPPASIPEQPRSVMERAESAASKGETELALRDYLWALDHGVDVNPAFVGIRNTLLIQKLIALRASEPSVMAELENRAAVLERAILTTEAPDVSLYIALNRERNQRDRTLRVYDQLRRQGRPVADELYEDVFELLLEQRRYADILNREDWCNKSLKFKQWLIADAVASFRALAADVFESFAGTNRNQEAMALLARVEAQDPSAESFVTLVKRALRAGNKELARLVLQRGRARASPEEQPQLNQAARELGLE